MNESKLWKRVSRTLISILFTFVIVSGFTLVAGWCFGIRATWKTALGVFVTTLYVITVAASIRRG